MDSYASSISSKILCNLHIAMTRSRLYTQTFASFCTTSHNETNADFVHSKKSVGKILILFFLAWISKESQTITQLVPQLVPLGPLPPN